MKSRLFLRVILCVMFGIASNFIMAQPGSIDNTFNTNGNPSTLINAVHILPDGKLLIGASNDLNTNAKISRHNIDGSIDNTFQNNYTSWNGTVESIGIASDGKIIIAGTLTVQSLGVMRSSLIRLFPDGSLDTSFTSISANGGIYDIFVQPDDKIIVIGGFSTFNGLPYNKILRLNANGTPDIAYNQNLGSGLTIIPNKAYLDAFGKLTLLGAYNFNGTNYPNGLVRINSNGTVDNTFSIGTGTASFEGFSDFDYTPDNKLLVSGAFSSINGFPSNDIARLNYDGSPDASFSSGAGPTCCGILNVRSEIGSDKIIICNGFYDYEGVLRSNLARLNNDGTLDLSYDPGAGFADNSTINALEFDNTGKLVIGGQFNNYNNVNRLNIVRINGGETIVPTEISIIGTATEAGTFNTDYQMTTTDGINYVRTNLLLAGDPNISNPETQVKFRQNYNWTVNWGASTFPTGTGIQDGPNIPIVTPGFYTVTINIQTGAYVFTLTGPPPAISMIGTALNGWTTDVAMEAVDGKNYIAYGVTLNTGELKFRQDASWAVNWGAPTFPQGYGVQDGANIPTLGGYYVVSFNRKTGYYSFDGTVGNNNPPSNGALTLSPQPCIESLFILGHNSGEFAYRIIDVSGKLMQSGIVNSKGIDVHNLPEGMYILQLNDTSGVNHVRRFIKSSK